MMMIKAKFMSTNYTPVILPYFWVCHLIEFPKLPFEVGTIVLFLT